MLNLRKGRALLKKYRDDESGNMALMFAVSSVAVVGCMGAAMDFSTRSNAKLHSQSIADQIALSAAIYVKDNSTTPKTIEDGYPAGEHSAADLGFDYQGFVEGGSENVKVLVEYDNVDKEAVVTVSGSTVPTFMQVLGKHDMSFSATSTVSYMQVDEMQPATVLMVLDNSGSMAWDHLLVNDDGTRNPDAKPRIDVLKSAVTRFRTQLQARIGDQVDTDGHRVLRTAIIPYNHDTILTLSANTDRVYWGFEGVSSAQVNAMTASGSTNSTPPMELAKELFTHEDSSHRAEAEAHNEDYREPVKFAVFMTDGTNTISETYKFVPDEYSDWYYRLEDGEWVGKHEKDLKRRERRNGGWERGYLAYDLEDTNRRTIEACRAMEEQGIKIFTIGFGLEIGDYFVREGSTSKRGVTEASQATAYSLLQQCASEPQNFIIAGENADLNSAFDIIQNGVVKELIRIKS